jgi:hypothetical protein
MLISWVMVGISIQIQVGVGGLPACSVPQGGSYLVSCMGQCPGREGGYYDSFHGELDVGMNVVEVVKELFSFFQSIKPYHECVSHVMEPATWLVGHPAKCHLLKVLHEEVDNHR